MRDIIDIARHLHNHAAEHGKAPLVNALVDIAERLWCDEHGDIKPSESTAAHSAADFVDAVTHTFNSLGVCDD